jgi:hypothetical protein
MFFSDPEAAFTNIRKSLKPGGRFVSVSGMNVVFQQGLPMICPIK